VNDILIAIVDGLKGFPEAINAVFAETQIQTCIVHLIRNSLDFCSWKDRKPVAQELKTVYHAEDAQAAAAALQEFEDGPWGKKFWVAGEVIAEEIQTPLDAPDAGLVERRRSPPAFWQQRTDSKR
jgi:putative transposase